MATKSKIQETSPKTDAIALLTDDHKKVKKLFKEFEKVKGNNEKKGMIVRTIIAELNIHAHLEEKYLYPAARETLKEVDLIDETTVEHATAKELISRLENMKPGVKLYDATVTVLGEYVEHHVTEEEKKIFPQLKKTKIDTQAMGEQMKKLKWKIETESKKDKVSELDASKANLHRLAIKNSKHARPERA